MKRYVVGATTADGTYSIQRNVSVLGEDRPRGNAEMEAFWQKQRAAPKLGPNGSRFKWVD
jgi:hypothetical protein